MFSKRRVKMSGNIFIQHTYKIQFRVMSGFRYLIFCSDQISVFSYLTLREPVTTTEVNIQIFFLVLQENST